MAIQFKPEEILEPQTALRPLPAARLNQAFARGITDRLFNRISSREVMFFTTQLSLMLAVDTPINVALQTIAEEIQHPSFKAVISAISRDIEEGRQLSESMKLHPRIFNDQFTSMVKAGETGGFLNKTLDRIVEMQEKRLAMINQVKLALTYPAFLCVIGFGVVVFILVGVLPKFAAFFAGKESILPWTTRFLMMASETLRHHWWAYSLFACGAVTGVTLWLKSPPGRALRDRLLVSGPLISGLTNKIYTCEMLRTIGHLMESQVPLLEALKATRPTIWNRYYRRFLDEISDSVDRGGRFSLPFSANPYIPRTVKQMVVIGEETGRLPYVMLRLAAFYDTEIEQELKKFAARIEPIALIIMGAVVGVIVSSIILPLFRLSQALR
ncbi:MAG: type II secretion system F family protein [Desulfobacterales bacterium]|nr:type II secretion system F family protein [Desulfobacterales bacterium]